MIQLLSRTFFFEIEELPSSPPVPHKLVCDSGTNWFRMFSEFSVSASGTRVAGCYGIEWSTPVRVLPQMMRISFNVARLTSAPTPFELTLPSSELRAPAALEPLEPLE